MNPHYTNSGAAGRNVWPGQATVAGVVAAFAGQDTVANVEDVIELDCDEDIADMVSPWSHPSTATTQLSYYQSREVVDMEWEKVGSMVTVIRSKGLRVSDNLLESREYASLF